MKIFLSDGSVRVVEKNQKTPIAMPEINEVFKLEHDFGNDSVNFPEYLGFRDVGMWRCEGKPLTGMQKGWFKLVQIGTQKNGFEVRKILMRLGTIPNWQWFEVLMERYNRSYGHGIADASWVSPEGRSHYLSFGSGGRVLLERLDTPMPNYFVWLLEVPKPTLRGV